MIKAINYILFLSLLLFSILLCSSVNGQSGENNDEDIDRSSMDWAKRIDSLWVRPIYQLIKSRIHLRPYDRIFKCDGILVHPNAFLAPRLCIDESKWYVVAFDLTRVSSSGFEILPNVRHHRLYPAVDYQSYRLASIEYKKKFSDTIIVKNDIVPGMVLLFFDMAIHFIEPVRIYDSPKFYQIYSKEINPNCVRISMMKDAQKQISAHRTPERILDFSDYFERYESFKISTHHNKSTEISYIEYDTFTPVFGTEQPKSSDLQTLLGSALVCKGQNDVPVLTGVLINTSYDGFNLYALVGGMQNWIQSKAYDFQKRTYRLICSNPVEMYQHDLP